MQDDIRNYGDRLRPAGILYVDVYPYRFHEDGSLRFLVLRRREDGPLPGDWQCVSGKIRKGERISEAFVRQVRVKSGLYPVRLLKFSAVTSFYDDYYDTVMLVPAAAAELPAGEVVIDPSVHVESRWVSPLEAHGLLRWKSQRDAIDSVVDAVLNGGTDCTPMALPAAPAAAPESDGVKHDR
jgi:ADP-ribose pyrophosphatase YjhB (NUDIX family)